MLPAGTVRVYLHIGRPQILIDRNPVRLAFYRIGNACLRIHGLDNQEIIGSAVSAAFLIIIIIFSGNVHDSPLLGPAFIHALPVKITKIHCFLDHAEYLYERHQPRNQEDQQGSMKAVSGN